MAKLSGREFMQNSLVVDLLGGSLGSVGASPDQPRLYGERLKQAGISVLNITLGARLEGIESFLDEVFQCLCLFREMPQRVMPVLKGDDFPDAKASGRIGVIMGCQGLDFIGRNTGLITILAKLGVRIAGLTYNEANAIGCGCMEPTDTGLSLVGRRVVRDLRSERIALDLSHVGYRTSMQAIELYGGPAIFTHSNAYGVTPNPRTIRDDQIKAAAASGGMVGVSPYAPFCHRQDGRQPTIEDFVDHLAYMVDLVGIDHVGIGTDLFPHTWVAWENGTRRNYPEMVGSYHWDNVYSDGFTSHQKFVAVPEALDRRGYSSEDIRKILGENAARVLTTAWDGSE